MGRADRERTLRERVLTRDGFRCVYCGEEKASEDLTLDHVQPRMRGGDHSEGNLVSACKACNAEKGSLPAWVYLVDRPEQRAHFLTHARGVWPRHRRAVVEAVSKRGGR